MSNSDRASRQGFLGETSEQILANARVAIIGLGGGGSHIAQQLAHVGVGQFVLMDDDHTDESNLNRMIGSRFEHARRNTLKTDVVADLVRSINPAANIVCSPTKWEQSHQILRECTVVFGCVDSFLA